MSFYRIDESRNPMNPINQTNQINLVMGEFNLDFDDAYQYVAAEKNDSIIVSLDTDFDRTERGRKTPWEVLQEKQG